MRELDQIGGLLSRGDTEEAARQAYALAPRFPDAHGLFNLLGVAAAAATVRMTPSRHSIAPFT